MFDLSSLLLADAVDDGLNYILYIVLLVAFLWGTIKVINGASNISRGEAGILDIVAGLLIAAAPLIVWNVFAGFGGSAASGLDPTTASDNGSLH